MPLILKFNIPTSLVTIENSLTSAGNKICFHKCGDLIKQVRLVLVPKALGICLHREIVWLHMNRLTGSRALSLYSI